MNNKIEELYNKIDYLNNIIDLQSLDIAKLKNKIDKAIEYVKGHTDKLKTIRVPKIDFDYNELLEILGDKEND